ncbi:Transaldolase [Apiospora kogelbergensis]|uniref:Transaldolase n=1 Tax=Apiospora kogelbergensis TaxID=1337665 RepID=A0AAW0RDZ4_9PEZI
MASAQTLLDVLRSHSKVDCDTFDHEVARDLGPFVDCTSNQLRELIGIDDQKQAIAYGELARLDADGGALHAELISSAVAYAQSHHAQHGGVGLAELAVEVMMVKLALRIVPYLTGYSHIQTNPMYSYHKDKTIENAKRIVAIFKDLDPKYDSKRVCIKIPATWEGMQACRELEKQGIATLATTMFCLEQAALASHAGCTYIAPYINELRVHFDETYVDENKAFSFCGAAQRFYEKTGSRTQVLPASLTSIQEVMMLAGAHHITVSPPLLKKLSETPANPWEGDTGSVFQGAEGSFADYSAIVNDESAWRLAFTRSANGQSEGKIIQAINIFCEKQEKLEELVSAQK